MVRVQFRQTSVQISRSVPKPKIRVQHGTRNRKKINVVDCAIWMAASELLIRVQALLRMESLDQHLVKGWETIGIWLKAMPGLHSLPEDV